MTGPTDVIGLHRKLVETPSVSGAEAALVEWLGGWFESRGAEVERLERNLIVRARNDEGPVRLLYLSHLDTVPDSPGWTRPPWKVTVEGDRLYGLGSNDAKAAVASMSMAFAERLEAGRAAGLALVFVCDEETGGRGAEIVFPEFAARGLEIESAVVGEPTGLDLAVAQKGMMVLELEESGDACHAAHARRLEAKNALIELARDLLALEELELGHEHAFLGRSTLVATVAKAGEARNRNPDFAHAVLDLRTVPGDDHEALHQLVRQTVRGTVHARSIRLRPCCIDADHDLVMDARALRPEARVFGSPTMSDWVFLGDVPALKCGPGQTDRSHVADEFVLASELDDGLDFYRRLAERRLNRN